MLIKIHTLLESWENAEYDQEAIESDYIKQLFQLEYFSKI